MSLEMATAKPPWSGAFDDPMAALFHIAASDGHPSIPEHLSDLVRPHLFHHLLTLT